jgi:hypothetical protein
MQLTRRQLFQDATALVGLLSMSGVVTRAFADDPAPLRAGEILPDPDFSLLSATTPYLVGIRPHRAGGLPQARRGHHSKPARVQVPHTHYGHGGAGITLSFGCASVVADHVQMLKREMRRPAVAVIGCGVIGLTVAAELRRRWRALPITIYAKDLDVRKTTSFVAAGQFEPSGICDEYETEDERRILADYLRRSRDRIVGLHNSSRWHRYGNCAQTRLYAGPLESRLRRVHARGCRAPVSVRPPSVSRS